MALESRGALDQIMVDFYLEPLRELLNPSRDSLMGLLMAESEKMAEADKAWLASLSPHDRKVELTRRRLSRCEARFREALNFTRYYDE